MTTLQKKRVLIADDHPGVRAGIRSMLSKAADITIIGEASNGIDALRLAQEEAPDVLLLDLEMPGMHGIEVARLLHESGSQVRILVLSSYKDKQLVDGVLEYGAAGYLSKEEAPELIIPAIRGVASGENGWFSKDVLNQLNH